MTTQWDNFKDQPETKEGYDNEYMRMFVKQFASYFLEVHDYQQEKPHGISITQETEAPIPAPQR